MLLVELQKFLKIECKIAFQKRLISVAEFVRALGFLISFACEAFIAVIAKKPLHFTRLILSSHSWASFEAFSECALMKIWMPLKSSVLWWLFANYKELFSTNLTFDNENVLTSGVDWILAVAASFMMGRQYCFSLRLHQSPAKVVWFFALQLTSKFNLE